MTDAEYVDYEFGRLQGRTSDRKVLHDQEGPTGDFKIKLRSNDGETRWISIDADTLNALHQAVRNRKGF